MKIKTQELLAGLIEKTNTNLRKVEEYMEVQDAALNHKASPEKWSVLECIEHLNLYGDFYIPEIKNYIGKSKTQSDEIFKSGLLGNYFVKSMTPKAKLNKMKTSADKNPGGSNLDKQVLRRFIAQQKDMLALMEQSKNISLAKTKTAISISKYLKLRLGDTFRFITAHNDRHLLQAEEALRLAGH